MDAPMKRDELMACSKEELVDTIMAMDVSLRFRDALLDMMPTCPEHGARCVGFAADWVMAARDVIASAEVMQDRGVNLPTSMRQFLARLHDIRVAPK